MSRYRIQESKYGSEPWTDVGISETITIPEYEGIAIEGFIAIAKHLYANTEKMEFRILDQYGNVVWQQHAPYAGVWINPYEPGWMRGLQNDYGIPDDLWAEECRRWLESREDV